MKRFIDQKLQDWKTSHRRKPLILRGARQVGKTYSVEQFGGKHFDNLAKVNLERNPDWHRVFENNLDAKRIVADLEILVRQKIMPGHTLLFIDEIQACPRAIIALRYFYEELPDLDVIAAGSLLEFAMKDIPVPVVRIQFLNVHPLSFAEYLLASGNDEAANMVLARPKKVTPTVHEFLIEELRRYFFVGGMPESVLSYVETGSVQESFEVQAEICETYRLDFAKYNERADKHCLNAVYYWSRRAKSSSAEVDYVGVMNGKIYPLEVKSGSPGRLKSLHLFLKTYKKSPKGIVLSVRPYEELPEKNLTYIPLYLAFSATGGKESLS